MNSKLLWLLPLVAWVALAAEPTYDKVDERALKAPPSVERNLKELAAYLCPPHYSDFEKARSIFRWVADRVTYDVQGLRSNHLGTQTPEQVLSQRKAVCEGYAKLFEALAGQSGLRAITLSGDSKYNDQLPFKLPPGVAGHGWNAVLLRGRWRLVDVTWAAGKVDDRAQFKKSFDDFWFCPTPEQFVYTHLPKDQRWQMLDKPWSAAHFKEVPQIRAEFFRLGLQPQEGQRQPLQVSDETVIRWPAPADVVGMSDLHNARGEPQPGWTFSQSPQGYLETRLRCPIPGTYTLRVYGRKRQPAWQGNLQKPDSYPGIAVFSVTAKGRSNQPYPKTFGSFQRSGAELLEPFQGRLVAGTRQRFRFKVPAAQEVAVFAGQDLLATLEFKDGVYETTVKLPGSGPPLQVCVKYPQESRYWGLVQYDLR